jgi:hypothetical protein
MTTKTGNSISSAAHCAMPRRRARSFRSLRWLNGSVHWISAVVLVYAFLINGETTGALVNPVAMRGEVKLGLVVGPSVRMPQTKIRRITDWGIYLGVAASVVSGLLIAYLRPGAELIRESRGFTTSSPALNVTIDAHAFVSDALEWLCGFHAAYSLWHWLMKRTQWGSIAGGWVERVASSAGRVGSSYLRGKNLRL